MSHEILGERFVARSKPAWHNIAQEIFSEDMKITAKEAMTKIAGDIKVIQSPVFYELPIVGEKKNADDPDVEMVKDEKHVAIVRKALPDDPQNIVLGITTDSWVAASYPQLAGALDKLGDKYKVETAGILKKGGLAFLCFRAEDYEIRGDEMRTYFAANFSLTPGVGHKIFHSPVRVVCWNTNTMAEGQATINLSIPHASDSVQRIELAANLVAKFKETKDKTVEIFNSFADLTITDKESKSIIEAAYPDPAIPAKIRLLKSHLDETQSETFKRTMTADMLSSINKAEEKYANDLRIVAEIRDVAFERYEEFEPVNLRGTAWASYNAVTEVSDWRQGRSADTSALFGGRAKEKARAFTAAYKMAAK